MHVIIFLVHIDCNWTKYAWPQDNPHALLSHFVFIDVICGPPHNENTSQYTNSISCSILCGTAFNPQPRNEAVHVLKPEQIAVP